MSCDSRFVSDVCMVPGFPVVLIIYREIWSNAVTADRKVETEVMIKSLRDPMDNRMGCVE